MEKVRLVWRGSVPLKQKMLQKMLHPPNTYICHHPPNVQYRSIFYTTLKMYATVLQWTSTRVNSNTKKNPL